MFIAKSSSTASIYRPHSYMRIWYFLNIFKLFNNDLMAPHLIWNVYLMMSHNDLTFDLDFVTIIFILLSLPTVETEYIVKVEEEWTTPILKSGPFSLKTNALPTELKG